MSGINEKPATRRVRRSVVRRTIVGSLVVMLSPFLTVVESDADAAGLNNIPIIYDSVPTEQLTSDVEIRLLPSQFTPAQMAFSSIETELRASANDAWSY